MSDKPNFCGPCLVEKVEIEGVVYCRECEEPLCGQCKHDHARIQVSRHHKLCDLANVPPREIHELLKNLTACPNHEKEEAVYLCKDHDTACCNKCAMTDHRKCEEVKVLSDIMNDMKVDFTLLKTVLHDLQQQGESILEHQRKHKELVYEIECNALSSLQTMKHKLLDMYAQLENNVLSAIANKKKEIGVEIKTNNEQSDHFLNELKQQSSYIEHVENFGTKEHLFFLQRLLEKYSICRLKSTVGELENNKSTSCFKCVEDTSFDSLLIEMKNSLKIEDFTCDVSETGSDTDTSHYTPYTERSPQLQSTKDISIIPMFDKSSSIQCALCDEEGHHEAACPKDQLPKVIAIASPNRAHLRILTGVVQQCLKDFSLTPDEIYNREGVRRNLELYIQELFPEAELTLFGSSMNGFGFHQSDFNICVTFHGKKPEKVNIVEHIEAICNKLKTHKGLYGVFQITTSKVPIVKFKHLRSQLEGDISLYNILAIQNTSLVCTYARMDPRVQMLGYAIKVFTKVCDIEDASRGSLSSYAYLLMMIHYLQQTKPPVIPVLQELSPGYPNPEFMVEGWNAWFFDDLTKLNSVWPHYGKNTDSVGALWEGFFRYFMEEFNFDHQVVTIRQFERLTKFEKLWNGKCLAIEDPFDLNHNLGGGLSRKMNHYVLSTLVRARELYSISVIEDTEPVSNADMMYFQDYFFDKEKLVTGDPLRPPLSG